MKLATIRTSEGTAAVRVDDAALVELGAVDVGQQRGSRKEERKKKERKGRKKEKKRTEKKKNERRGRRGTTNNISDPSEERFLTMNSSSS